MIANNHMLDVVTIVCDECGKESEAFFTFGEVLDSCKELGWKMIKQRSGVTPTFLNICPECD